MRMSAMMTAVKTMAAPEFRMFDGMSFSISSSFRFWSFLGIGYLMRLGSFG